MLTVAELEAAQNDARAAARLVVEVKERLAGHPSHKLGEAIEEADVATQRLSLLLRTSVSLARSGA